MIRRIHFIKTYGIIGINVYYPWKGATMCDKQYCNCGTRDEDYECFVEFTRPLGGKVLINIYQILAIIEDHGIEWTDWTEQHENKA